MIKAVFLDIDGTIISIKTHKIPESAVSSIRRIRKSGVKVFLCTSRACQFLSNIPGLDVDGYVCLTGAHCLDSSFRTIKSVLMSPLDIAQSVTYVQRTGQSYFALAADNLYVVNPENPIVNKVLSLGGLSLDSLSCGYRIFPNLLTSSDPVALAAELGIIQVTAYFTLDKEEAFMKLMPHSHTERWANDFTDIVPNGVDKASGIDVMADYFGFSLDETMAVGDGGNDISMIRHASVGVAMGNAPLDVQQCADYVTSDVDDDGLKKALDRYV